MSCFVITGITVKQLSLVKCMRRSRTFCQEGGGGGPGQSDKKKLDDFFFFFFSGKSHWQNAMFFIPINDLGPAFVHCFSFRLQSQLTHKCTC